ncbi:PTS sugar transporter subunit IIA [uncultured Oscillibacter sp.]|uniref:PTS sugar transporter subunit IIA n=1 Tax=uncultured Oscillibacter sp. TaxID=876091 RepID=UPI0025EF3290|nr:PTS sugar transporter subunit IIA [uncultured Oscillibacter sp.]
MISVLLISHGNMAEAMIDSAQMVMGKQLQLDKLALLPEDSTETFQEKLNRKIEEMPQGDGLIILSDFPLGTPFNTVVQMGRHRAFQHLTGMSMPMLLCILKGRAESAATAESLCEQAMCSVRQDCFYVNQFIRKLKDQQHPGEVL